jgi:hypothetical protein
MPSPSPSPFPVEVITDPWTIATVIIGAISALAIIFGALAGIRQIRLAREAANGVSSQLSIAAGQLEVMGDQVKAAATQTKAMIDLETQRRTMDIINEVWDRLQDVSIILYPTNVITQDAATAVSKYRAYLKAGGDRSNVLVDLQYIDTVNSLANYFDKADVMIATGLIDEEMLLNLYSGTLIRFYATFREAYFENPGFPVAEGIRRRARNALAHYRKVTIGVQEPQFAGLEF